VPADPDEYLNECCWGGDVVRDRLLPAVQKRFTHIQTAQEDWGWFIWFKTDSAQMAVDTFCDDREPAPFRVVVTMSVQRWWLFTSRVDGEEAGEVASIVRDELNTWGAEVTSFEKVQAN